MEISAVVLSAGESNRMMGIDKQFLVINEIPVFIKSLIVFERNNFIDEIIFVTKKESIKSMEKIIKKFNLKKVKHILAGDSTRIKSSKIGVSACKNEYVLVHDGARPFVSQSLVNSICENLNGNDCVVPGVKITDTIKVVDDNGMVEKTLNRIFLRAIQTPQGFKKSVYFQGINNLREEDLIFDDAGIIENINGKVLVIDGEKENIKITSPEDISKFYKEMGNKNV